MYIQFLILVFWLNLHTLTAYRNGQVTQACMSMTPGHGFNPSTLEPPYTVTSDASNYTDGQVITVTLHANETGFRGFLLQARDEKGPVGTFTVMGKNTQLLTCGTNDSAVSHTSNDDKSNIVVQWKAPNSNNTDIWFRATFVQNSSIFWVGVQSDPVRFLATNPPNVTVSPPNTTDFPTNATVFPTNTTVFPTNATVFPTNATVSTPNTTVSPPNTTVFPPNTTVFPTNATVFPTNATVSPTNATVSTPNRTTDDSPSISLTWCLFLLPLLAII